MQKGQWKIIRIHHDLVFGSVQLMEKGAWSDTKS